MPNEKGIVKDATASTGSLEQTSECIGQASKVKDDQAQAKVSEQTSTQKEQETASKDSSEQIDKEIKQVKKEEYDYARSRIKRQRNWNKSWKIVSCLMAIVISLVVDFTLYIEDITRRYTSTFYIVVGIVSFVIGFLLCYFLGSVLEQEYLSRYQTTIDLYEFANMQDEVEDNLFESSIKMSYKYLDQYYAQTKDQANKGFIITSGVTIAGATLLFVGIICMFIDKTDASKITVASGVIVEFISAIMFYLYNRTVQSMGNYHDKLFLSQNVAMVLLLH